jgi:hypothetical protein
MVSDTGPVDGVVAPPVAVVSVVGVELDPELPQAATASPTATARTASRADLDLQETRRMAPPPRSDPRSPSVKSTAASVRR